MHENPLFSKTFAYASFLNYGNSRTCVRSACRHRWLLDSPENVLGCMSTGKLGRGWNILLDGHISCEHAHSIRRRAWTSFQETPTRDHALIWRHLHGGTSRDYPRAAFCSPRPGPSKTWIMWFWFLVNTDAKQRDFSQWQIKDSQ